MMRVKREEEEEEEKVDIKPAYDFKRPWDVKVKGGDFKEEVEREGASAKTPWDVKRVKREKGEGGEKKQVKKEEEGEKKRVKKEEVVDLDEAKVVTKAVEAVHRARKRRDLSDASETTNVTLEGKEGRPTLVPAPAAWEMDSKGLLEPPRPLGEPHALTDRLVCLRNYSAVGATEEVSAGRQPSCYGLIDRGTRQTGVRALLMHSTKSGVMDQVRPGARLRVKSTLPGGVGGTLKVLYTTPARYYSPGERVTTLSVGVDAADWQSLVPTGCRI